MRNVRAAPLYLNSHSWTMLLLYLSLLSAIHTVNSKSDGSREFQWQILTKTNFSSQIRLHPHILLMVTVPWSGESRSLMKELAHVVTKKQEKFRTLKLMLIHRNRDRMLADALGANEGINIIYYRHALPYKYQGALRVQNILSSGHYLMLLSPEEIPLKSLTTPVELKTFLNSTDKALLLLEFCGWRPKLMAKVKNNGSESAFGGLLGTGLDGQMNETLTADGKNNQKRMVNEKINCGVDNGFSGIPELGEFTPMNESDFLEAENMRPSDGVSCSFEEFRQFDSFLSNFTSVVREFFLPPERIKFGLVSERSLLSSLGIGNSASWSMMLYFAGCPGCTKVLRRGNDLKRVLEDHASPVTELKSNEHDLEPGLPANRPSILLFIDRSSDSWKVRRKSKEALDVFRELALHNQIPNRMSAQNGAKPQKFSAEAQASRTISGHPKIELSPLSEKISALKDEMSIMIMNEGKHVTLDKVASDLQGSSLHEILEYVLQHRKEIKLSSLAKDVGFQLLSDDFGIRVSETLPTQTEVQSNQLSAELLIENLLERNVECQKDQALCNGEQRKVSKPNDAKYSTQQYEKSSVDTSNQLSINPEYSPADQVVLSSADGEVKEETLSEVEKGFQQLYLTGFDGFFFFSDGQFRLLKALTACSRVPSLVIIDPLSQQHYVFPEEAVFSYSSLSSFLDMFLNGSLLPYQRAESVILDPREGPRPPLVNLDFHEVDSIPRVTTQTFLELVVGNQSGIHAGNAWMKDVLVLFSSSRCGFCQRMELFVCEVYRAFKGYGNMLKSQFRNEKSSLRSDDVNNTILKLPLIYLMDCTWNDCSSILKTMTQRELYPSLLLFPAERKKAVSYEGDISVFDIIMFMADHGSNSHWLYRERGILWNQAQQGAGNKKLFKDASEAVMHEEAPLIKEKHHEILLKDTIQKVAVKSNKIRPHKPYDSNETASHVVPGSILVATDKLENVHPFDGSKILILKVNQSTGFQGLIINKQISWDSFQELEEGLEPLKEAPLSLGGPIIIRGMPLVALSRKSFEDQYQEVLPDIYYLDQWAAVNVMEGIKLGNQSVMTHYWFFLGYSSWGWDQLFDEIAGGAWNISNANVEQFDWPLV